MFGLRGMHACKERRRRSDLDLDAKHDPDLKCDPDPARDLDSNHDRELDRRFPKKRVGASHASKPAISP